MYRCIHVQGAKIWKRTSERMSESFARMNGWMDGWSFVFPLLVPFQSSVLLPKQRTHLTHIPNLIACHDSASANTHFLHCSNVTLPYKLNQQFLSTLFSTLVRCNRQQYFDTRLFIQSLHHSIVSIRGL